MRVQLSCYKQPKISLKQYNPEIAQGGYIGALQGDSFAKITKDFFNSSLISFKGIDRSPEHFEVKKAYGLICPCCGKVMLTKKQLSAFTSRTMDKRGCDLQKELLKEMEYFRPNEKAIAEILIEESKKAPEADLGEIVSKRKDESISRLEERQKKLLDEMEKEVSKLDEPLKECLGLIIEEARNSIDTSNDDIFFRRKHFIQEIKELLESESEENTETGQAIITLAEKMPSSNTSVDAFFVKYSRRENKEIASRLVLPSLITTEHVRPQSYDGADNTDNYIPMCSECNSKRGNTPYNTWFEEHPEMPENLQKFLNQISTMIQNGEFQGAHYYDTYVDGVIEAIKEATEGKLILKAPDEIDDKDENVAPEIDTSELTIEEKRELWIKAHAKKLQELSELEEKRAELKDDEEYLLILDYISLHEKSRAAKTRKDTAQTEYNKRNRRLYSRREALKRAEKKDEPDLAAISNLKKAIDEITVETEVAKGELDRAGDEVAKIEAQLDELKSRLSLPDILQARITKLKKRLEELERVKSELRNIASVLDEEDSMTIELSYLNSDIKERKAANKAFGDSINFESEDNKQMAKNYFLLKSQYETLDNVDMGLLRSAFKSKTPPDFVIEYTKELLDQKMAQTLTNEAARYLREEDEIKALEEKRKELKAQLAECDALKLKRTSLQQKARLIKNGNSEKSLRETLDQLIKTKARVTNKFQHINIDERIIAIRAECDDLLQKYAESFEKEDYQHSNSSVDTSSSSSSIS